MAGKSSKSKRGTKAKPPIYTARALEHLEKFLSGAETAEVCARELGIARQTVYSYLHDAYAQGYLRLRAPVDGAESPRLGQYYSEVQQRWVAAHVLKGQPDHGAFARGAGEKLLEVFLKNLRKETPRSMVIGLIGGSSVAAAVIEMLNERLWEEMASDDDRKRSKDIYILGLNNTPSWGDDLVTSSVVIAANMAGALGTLLHGAGRVVYPLGLGSQLVIRGDDDDSVLREVDASPANRKVIALADPERLDEALRERAIHELQAAVSRRHKTKGSDVMLGGREGKLDMVITGVGGVTPGDDKQSSSVFTDVLRAEGVEGLPVDVVGDVGYTAVDKDGNEVKIFDKAGKRVRLYSAISLEQLKRVAQSGECDVVLVARNYRRDESVPKTEIIHAALKGRCANIVITDAQTSAGLRGPAVARD